MDTYRLFDTVYVLTQGGPGLATETVGFYTYRTGFTYLNMGYALTLSIDGVVQSSRSTSALCVWP